MGIKGIYQEIGEGERVALVKLAAESLEKQGRPLRVAIDIAIWQFQNQAAQGGTNPEIRNLFYRLVRLLACPIEPIFVFDGPYKPRLKRNKKSGRGDSIANAQAKRLIRLFGCNTHDAPGEAEAECALLQKHGIVDAVLSEDVDTLMFGCTKMLRQWSPQSKRQTTPTHISILDTEKMNLADQGLTREGMVLVALMSGGDYDPNGLIGCGIKVAVEAAKAGFGKTLCRLKASDKEELQAWRNSLIHELRTNESGHFKRRNKALTIPQDFPDITILRYYTHPVVSPESSLDEIREKVQQKREIQFEHLREFTREVFGWDYRGGAIKFIRVLSHAVLVNRLQGSGHDHTDLVKGISGFRSHVASDMTPEVRIQHVPLQLVPIDLSQEADERIVQGRGGLALNSDEEVEDAENIEEDLAKSSKKPFDPSERLGIWTVEALVRKSIPEALLEAEIKFKDREKALLQKKQPKATGSKPGPKLGMPTGSLNKYMRATKPLTAAPIVSKDDSRVNNPKTASLTRTTTTTSRRLQIPSPLEPSKQPASTTGSPVRQTTTPWTLASSQVTPRTRNPPNIQQQAIIITSSPPCPADSPPPSPSPRPWAYIPTSQELPGTMRTIPASSGSPQRVKNSTRNPRSTIPPTSSQASQSMKLKQTSMDMFTKKSKIPTPTQPLIEPASLSLKRPPKTKQIFDDAFDSDSSSDLVPLSTLLSHPSTSLNKEHQETLTTNRSASPSAAPARKKKLLIPRASAVGFFKEIEVDAEERDELLARETAALERRGVRANVLRVSDVGYIDLTQDD
ncbi:hypothetical protein F66182_2936 [Fusarium sp. NRRL 66182]|nr:hypothetical protein F66182_2936 [Fusarium sp. NRRL 66182]